MKKRIWICATGNIGVKAVLAFFDLHARNSVRIDGIITHAIEEPQNETHLKIAGIATNNNIKVVFSKNLPYDFWHQNKNIDYIFAIKWRYMIAINPNCHTQLIIFHASPLPKRRGFAPVQWALLLGENKSAVTMFIAAPEVDAGPILAQSYFDISEHHKANDVDIFVEDAIVKLIQLKTPILFDGSLHAIPQNEAEATYVPWLDDADAQINWNQTGEEIINHQRAFSEPYPLAFTYYGDGIKLFPVKMHFLGKNGPPYEAYHPGKLLAFTPKGHAQIACKDGIIEICAVQHNSLGICTPKTVISKLKTRFY